MFEIEVKNGLVVTVNTKHISALEKKEFGGVFYLKIHMVSGDTFVVYTGEEDPQELYMDILQEVKYNFDI